MIERRKFLGATAASLALGIARRAMGGEKLLRYGDAPQQLATPLALFDRLITPTPAFFVRSHFGPPALDRRRKLVIDGLVKKPLSFTVDELGSLPSVTSTSVLQCAGNGRSLMIPRVPGVQWGHGAMGQATWTGVRLRDLLSKAGVDAKGLYVKLEGADRSPKPTVPPFVRSIPIARALDPSTLVVYAMNGEPLTLAHGAPIRLIVPGWAADHWVKWLTHITVQAEEAEGFYMRTAYKYPVTPGSPGAPVPAEQMRSLTTFPVKSVIARPGPDAKVPVGPQEVVGVAFSGDAPIAGVEVSIDGGKTWGRATLEGEPGVGRWQVFRFRFVASAPGKQRAMARATDAKKNVQPEEGIWNPSGYHWNGWHRTEWEVVP